MSRRAHYQPFRHNHMCTHWHPLRLHGPGHSLCRSAGVVRCYCHAEHSEPAMRRSGGGVLPANGWLDGLGMPDHEGGTPPPGGGPSGACERPRGTFPICW